MAYILPLNQFKDARGTLTVVEKIIPFDIKRVYYIQHVDDGVRGGHRHKESIQALICISGSCVISNNNSEQKDEFLLNSSNQCLILMPEDWHTMHTFSHDAVLLVLASTLYDKNDYIDEPYEN